MLRIGDFSKIGQVTIKTLRFYDERGLLKPAHVDEWSGYRYYMVGQLTDLNRILAMRDLGFSIEEIERIMHRRPDPDRMAEMLWERKREIVERLEHEQMQLQRVEARLRQIEQEGAMSEFEVVVKSVEPAIVASIRETIPAYPAVGMLYGDLYRHLGRVAPGFARGCAAIWHDPEYKESDVDAEAIVFLSDWASGDGRIKVYELPGVETTASLVFTGPYSEFNRAYGAITKWIDENGYRIAGPNREIYLRGPEPPGNQNDPNCVSEIQFPVERS